MSQNRLREYANALLIISFCFLILSCTAEKPKMEYVDYSARPDLVDQSWLTGKPCTAPCWQGLEPGKSTREEVMKVISKLSFLDTEKDITIYAGQEFLYCKQPPDKTCLGLVFNNNQLSQLGLLLNYSVTLDEVVDKLKKPDFFVISYPGSERMDCLLRVYWLQRRLELTYRSIGKPFSGKQDLCHQIQESGGLIPKGVEIEIVSISSPEVFDELTDYFYDQNIETPWSGFSE